MIKKEDLFRKISSRKFQVAIVGMLIPLFALSKIDELTQQHLIAIVTSVLTLIAYIFAEAHVDGKRVEGDGEQNKEDKNFETLENDGGGGIP